MKTKNRPTRKAEYKLLLFTTTVRNPERIKYNLRIFKNFDGEILTNELAEKIVGELIKFGLYRPMKVKKEISAMWKNTQKGEFATNILSDKEVFEIMENNPQEHKEFGFSHGYASRFATIFDFAKEMGFVYFKVGQKIEFSELGNILASIVNLSVENNEISVTLENIEKEQQVFLQSMARSQRCNPFVKVLNDNIPLVLLLQTIKLINADADCGNNCGISRKELPLLLFWKDNDATSLYLRIKELRKNFGYTPSDETIIDICINEIMGGKYKKIKMDSICSDYTDEFIRKMRMTGLFSLRGEGRFFDINHNEDEKANYILENYAEYSTFDDEYEYFKYMSKIDENLISLKEEKQTETETNELLEKWLEVYDFEKIKNELHNLAVKKPSKDDVLKLLNAPVRLEFLISLLIKEKFPLIIVKPNYSADDTGLPTSTAGGNKGDIECFENENGILVEVTMAEGRTQTMMEIWPIERHLKDFIEKNKFDAQCVFIAPSIFLDSKHQIDFVC